MAKKPANEPQPTSNSVSSEDRDGGASEIQSGLRDVTRSDAGTSSRSNGERREIDQSDADLMAQLAQGEVDALEVLYDRYSTLVFSLGLRILRDPQLAEDVVQEVFIRLWRRPASYDPARGRFVSWLMSVSRNRALDEQRRVSRRMRAEETDDDPAHELPTNDRFDDPQAGVLLDELRRRVREAMTRLPPAQRQVIELAYFGGLTQVEIAQRTGEPLGTVKTRVRLGMNKLRAAIGPDAEDDVRAAAPASAYGRRQIWKRR